MAKNVAATKAGHFNIFNKTIDNIIVAIGSAKKSNNNVFIRPPFEQLNALIRFIYLM